MIDLIGLNIRENNSSRSSLPDQRCSDSRGMTVFPAPCIRMPRLCVSRSTTTDWYSPMMLKRDRGGERQKRSKRPNRMSRINQLRLYPSTVEITVML